MRRPRMMEKVLDAMTEKFSYTEFIKKAQTYEVSPRTAKRWLKSLRKKQLIEKQEDIYIKLETALGKGDIRENVTKMSPTPLVHLTGKR